MKILYDHKFGCLLIEMEREELALTAKKICEENNREELLGHHIRSIRYRIKRDENKKPIAIFLSWLVWIFVALVIVLGIFKLLEILKSFI